MTKIRVAKKFFFEKTLPSYDIESEILVHQ